MRKVLISVAAAGAALIAAAPASAQYYGGQPYGAAPRYGQNYGYADRGDLQRELQRIRFQADNLGRQGRLSGREARDLYRDIASAERRLYRADDPRDLWNVRQRINQIRYELRRYSDYDYRDRRGDQDDRWEHRDRD